MNSESDGFIREVDEAVQRDRLSAFWQRYGRLIVAAAILIVAAVAAVEGWQWYEHSRDQSRASTFSDALTQAQSLNDASARAQSLETAAAELNEAYAPLARLRAAAAWIEAGDTARADQILDEMSRDSRVHAALRQAAEANLALVRAQGAAHGVIPPAGDLNDPWRYTKLEAQAAADLRAGETASAIATLQSLSDDANTPASMRARANELLAALGTDMSDMPDGSATEAAP